MAGRPDLPVAGLLDNGGESAGADPAGLEAQQAGTGGDGAGEGVAPVQAAAAADLDGYGERRPPFGQWLLAQKGRDDTLGDLIAGAKRDPAFPKRGDPDEVRARLRKVQADDDIMDAVDKAEIDWLSY